jgi:hypothetical protein
LLVGSSEPFAIGGFGDETVGWVRAVAGNVLKGVADPAFCTGGGAASVPAMANA